MSKYVNEPTNLTEDQRKLLDAMLNQAAYRVTHDNILPGSNTIRTRTALDPYGRIISIIDPTAMDDGPKERSRFDLMVDILNRGIPDVMADYNVEENLPNVAFADLDVVTMHKDDVRALGTFIDAISNKVAELDPDWDVKKDGDGQSWLEQHMPEFMGTHGRVFDLMGGLIYPGNCYKKDGGDED